MPSMVLATGSPQTFANRLRRYRLGISPSSRVGSLAVHSKYVNFNFNFSFRQGMY